jgi:hypothetical protein
MTYLALPHVPAHARNNTWLVTNALDSSKMTLMPLTARTQANVRSQTKHSLAKVCGAAASGLSLLGAMQ